MWLQEIRLHLKQNIKLNIRSMRAGAGSRCSTIGASREQEKSQAISGPKAFAMAPPICRNLLRARFEFASPTMVEKDICAPKHISSTKLPGRILSVSLSTGKIRREVTLRTKFSARREHRTGI